MTVDAVECAPRLHLNDVGKIDINHLRLGGDGRQQQIRFVFTTGVQGLLAAVELGIAIIFVRAGKHSELFEE